MSATEHERSEEYRQIRVRGNSLRPQGGTEMSARKKNPYRRFVRVVGGIGWCILGVLVTATLVGVHVLLWREYGALALLLIPGFLGAFVVLAFISAGFVWIEQRWKRAEHEWDKRKGVSS